MKRKNETNYSQDNAKYFNGQSGHSTQPIYNLKLSEEEKTKDWYIEYMEYIAPTNSFITSDVKEMQACYDIYNGDISSLKEFTASFTDPLGEDELSKMEETLLAYPKMHNKVNVIKGEMLKRNDNFRVLLLSANAIKNKNQKLIEELKNSVEEAVMLEIERQQAAMEGMNPQQIEEFIDSIRTQETPPDILKKDFKSESEIFYNHVLKYAYHDQDIKFKQLGTIEDTWLADRCFLYVGWEHGRPVIQVRNPKFTGFHKSANQFYVQKGDHVWYRQPLTPAEVLQKYDLSEEEMEELGLGMYSRSHTLNSKHDVLGGNAVPVFDTLDVDLAQDLVNRRTNRYDNLGGLHQDSEDGLHLRHKSLIWETHLEFKAFQQVIYLDYKDDMGENITTIVSSKFKIPRTAQKIKFTNRFGERSTKWVWDQHGTQYTAEKIWIPKKYEVVRLGESVYPEGYYREVPFQSVNIEKPYSSFELSTKGAIFTSRNSNSVSLFRRGIPLYLQYLYVKHLQNRELAKYQGYVQDVDTDQIPEELGKDINGELIKDPIAVWMLYRKRTGINFYSGSQTTMGTALPSTRSPGSSSYLISTAQDIFNLQQLAELIDRELGMTMGISPQREAAFDSNSNVSDNRQSITQSHHITEPYYYMHSLIWRDALKDYLMHFRTYVENIFESEESSEHYLHYILPDGTEELLKVTPEMTEMTDIALFASNSGYDQAYAEVMMQLVHSISQNAGQGAEAVSSLVKAITSGASPEETHKLIQLEADRQAQRQQASMQAQEEAQLKAVKLQVEAREDEQAHKVELAHIKGKYDLMKGAQTAYLGQDNLDLDGDGVPDPVEIMKAQLNANIKQQEIELKKEDQNIKREEMKSKEKMEENKMKAAKAKPASKS